MCKAINLAPNSPKKVIKKRHRVTFTKGSNGGLAIKTQVRLIQPISREDYPNVYYSREEKHEMKESARNVADEIYFNSPSPYSSAMLRAFTCCCKDDGNLTDEEKQGMIRYTALDDHLRGMEKSSVEGLYSEMIKYRIAASQSVVEAYSIAMANHGYLSEATQEAIAKTYRDLGAPLVKYAALKAELDEQSLLLVSKGWGDDAKRSFEPKEYKLQQLLGARA